MSMRVATEGDETVDLHLLVTVDRKSEVEVQSALPAPGCHRGTAPRDLRTTVWRADRGLLVLVLVLVQRPPSAALQRYATLASRHTGALR